MAARAGEPGRRERVQGRLALLLLLAVWITFHFPAFAGRVLFPVDHAQSQPPLSLYQPGADPIQPLDGDAFQFYYPWESYLGRRLREGDLPMWDPYRLSGTPYAADPNTAVFYPLNWLFGLGDTLRINTVVALLSRLLALLIGYWFFRTIAIHPYAAAIGAITFVFSGFLLAWSSHPSFFAAGMWLPLALGGLEVAFRGRPGKGIPLAASGLGLSVLGGQGQITLFVWLATALWALVAGAAAVYRDPSRWARSIVRIAAVTGLSFVFAAGLASLQVLASMEMVDDIARQQEPYEGLVANALPPNHLVMLLFPDRFGNPIDRNYSGYANYHEATLYAGVAALILSLIALLATRTRMAAALTAIAGLGTLCSLGTPFYKLLYTAVPYLSHTRAINRFVFLVDFGLAGLAALGADALMRRTFSWGKLLPVSIGASLVVIAGMAVGSKIPRTPVPIDAVVAFKGFALATAGALLVVAIAAVPRRALPVLGVTLVGIVAADLWLYGFRYHPFHKPASVYPQVPEVRFLQQLPGPRDRFAQLGEYLVPPIAALEHGLYDIGGESPFILTRYAELVSIAQPGEVQRAYALTLVGPFAREAIDSPIIDLLGVSYILSNSGGEEPAPPAYAGQFTISERTTAFPPAFVAPCWRAANGRQAIPLLGGMSSNELRSTVVLDEPVEGVRLREPPAECAPGPEASIELYEPERVVIRTPEADGGLLVLTDTWSSGWQAQVDGRPAPVLRAYWALRAIPMPPGSHRVELVYRPWWVLPGITITILSAAALVVIRLRAKSAQG